MVNITEDIIKGLKDSIDLHGPLLKTIICMEEMGELTQAISKTLRNQGNKDNLTEEIADVTLCLEILKIINNIDDDAINKIISYKMERQVIRDTKRVEEGNTEHHKFIFE